MASSNDAPQTTGSIIFAIFAFLLIGACFWFFGAVLQSASSH